MGCVLSHCAVAAQRPLPKARQPDAQPAHNVISLNWASCPASSFMKSLHLSAEACISLETNILLQMPKPASIWLHMPPSACGSSLHWVNDDC